jgi:hypothetical protein
MNCDRCGQEIPADEEMELPELERELATLRHMEKVRAQMREFKKIVCLWES